MSRLRQVITTWSENEDHTRLSILWDNDIRDSMTSLVFPTLNDAMKHLASMHMGWRIDGFDVDITNVSVLNAPEDYKTWHMDFDPKNTTNARCFTLT